MKDFNFSRFDARALKTVATDAQNFVYLGGVMTETVDFDPGPGVNNLTSTGAMYITKLDASGNFLWAKLLEKMPVAYTFPVPSTAIA